MLAVPVELYIFQTEERIIICLDWPHILGNSWNLEIETLVERLRDFITRISLSKPQGHLPHAWMSSQGSTRSNQSVPSLRWTVLLFPHPRSTGIKASIPSDAYHLSVQKFFLQLEDMSYCETGVRVSYETLFESLAMKGGFKFGKKSRIVVVITILCRNY